MYMAQRMYCTSRRFALLAIAILFIAIYSWYFTSFTSNAPSSVAVSEDRRQFQHCQRLASLKTSSLSRSENLTKTVNKKLKPVCRKRLPDSLIIGVAKAGTFALLKFLTAHPEVVRNDSYKELYFFDRKYDNGVDWYIDQMPYSTPGQIVLEKSPFYFVRPEVPERVFSVLPRARILLTVRDPVARAVSAYVMESDRKKGHIKPFNAFIIMEPSGNVKGHSPFVSDSTYDVHMERWLKYFPRQQIHVVDGENLVKKPFEELGKIEEFLGISRYLTRDKFIFNETKHFYCLDGPQMECLFESKGRKHPHVDESVVEKMRQFFKPHNERFFELIGKRMNWT